MALTEKGANLLQAIQGCLEAKGEGSSASVEEIAEFGDLTVPSVRGTMGKLQKEGYIESEAVEVEEGKKRKRITLTDMGWEWAPGQE